MAAFVLYALGRVAPLLLMPAGVDLLLAALFVAAYLKAPGRDSPAA